MGLYQIHWPGFITNGFVNDAFVRGLADCANQGLASAVGVSNFKPDRVRSAAKILKARPVTQRGVLPFSLEIPSLDHAHGGGATCADLPALQGQDCAVLSGAQRSAGSACARTAVYL